MDFGRRRMMLGGLGLGLAALAWPRLSHARGSIVPGDVPDRTAFLQHLIDESAAFGRPLRLPAGVYATRTLTLKSGTRLEGIPGRTVLRSCGGGSILRVEQVENVRLTGLVLDGDNQPLGAEGALLVADDVSRLDISECHFIESSEDGIALHCVSGRIAGCTIARIGGTALLSAECRDLAIVNNRIERAATGLSLTGAPDDSSVVAKGNVISGLFLRKTLMHSGVGIVADSGVVISGNSIHGAPAYGILIVNDRHAASVSDNTIRNAYIDVAVSAPLSPPGGVVFVA